MRGLVQMSAKATQSLSRFNLDYAGDDVQGVWVDGRKASFRHDERELVITPARAIRSGSSFKVQVSFTGHTVTPAEGDPGPLGWFTTRDGSVTSGQINHAQEIYPVNDHPSDKATYSYTIAAPKATTVAVSGRRTGRRAVGDSYVWSFEMDEPMASQVIQVATGDLVEVQRGNVAGTRLRDVVARNYVDITNPTLSKGPAQFRWMLGHAGAYPFDEYGVLAVDQFMQYALETQTLTLHPAYLFDPAEMDPHDSRSRSLCTSSPTSGSATRWRSRSTATCGWPRARPPGTSTSSTPTSTARTSRRSCASSTRSRRSTATPTARSPVPRTAATRSSSPTRSTAAARSCCSPCTRRSATAPGASS